MPSMREFSTWLTPNEAGKRIGMSKQALYRHLYNGKFRAVSTHNGWLLDPASVDRFAAERRRPQKGEEHG